MINIDLENVEVSGGAEVQPGAYVGIIKEVQHYETKQGIVLWLDIDEGECKGYYEELYSRKEFWGLSDFRSYKNGAVKYFKKFIDDVTASNPRFKWTGDEQKLAGKRIGMILKSDNYTKADGSLGYKLVVDKYVPVSEIATDNTIEGFVKVTEEKIEGIPFH